MDPLFEIHSPSEVLEKYICINGTIPEIWARKNNMWWGWVGDFPVVWLDEGRCYMSPSYWPDRNDFFVNVDWERPEYQLVLKKDGTIPN